MYYHAENATMINLRSLRTFVMTAEMGGLGRACARLNLSQPAASRQIQALEAELGVPLFEHVGRGLRLTSHGEDLLQRSRQLLTYSELLTEHAQALRSGKTGTLKVGATPQIIGNLIAPFLPGHRRDHPGIDVQLIEGGDAQQRTRLERGEVHLTIMPVGGAGLSYRLLAPVHALAVLLKSHPLSRRKVIEVDELTKHPLLMLQRGYGSRAWFDAECESAQVKPIVLVESTTAHTLTELAAVGHGIAVVPSTAAVRDPLRTIPIVHRGTSVGRWVAICWNPRRALPSYSKLFVDELQAHARHAFPGRAFVKRAPALPKPSEPAP
jgi:LysR family transcriptional regulator, cyn operon transcriptional activator